MTLPTGLQSLLPQKFLGFIPLFIGVEVILGVTILNKASGLYGILSLFTGHPINFLQWLYNSLALLMLPVYVMASITLENQTKSPRKISFATVVFCLDTLIGTFYTMYFIYFWFTEDGSGGGAARHVRAESSISASSPQSASQQRELFFIFSTTILTTAFRYYFTLVMLSFTKILLKQNAQELRYKIERTQESESSSSEFIIEDPEEAEIANSTGLMGEFKNAVFDLEMRSKDLLDEILN
ncbi:hypothetical protein KGF56_004561 [Candida oxycetoniae]|uniref:Inositol phosphorylceramide synthase regulatory subunit KEI1 n=1 Tax=Candida oxycetoniae TaxID=497107 RepID=A0AAI9WVY4_9ASCO|nr:uncharacterized protein KGF56_004561 [Candida oxycetoniae]KAI3402680.2 hypothetical protein KGF56_004561 [Candida oxycetoniae]